MHTAFRNLDVRLMIDGNSGAFSNFPVAGYFDESKRVSIFIIFYVIGAI